jgi:hypothetical protein
MLSETDQTQFVFVAAQQPIAMQDLNSANSG